MMDACFIDAQKCRYGGTAAFNAGVGECARADARIILEGCRTKPIQLPGLAAPDQPGQHQRNPQPVQFHRAIV
jgi:hypothetical protein